jgi:cytochrome b
MKFRIWDLPLRVFHWLLVLAVLFSFITVKIGGNAMEWHARLGYFVLALLLFRLIWGFVGSHYARFSNFIKGPRSLIDYLKNPQQTPGHSPLGALSVVVLLSLFGFQVIAGLFASDEIAFDGPLVKYVSSAWVELMTSLHRLNEPVLLTLVLVHIGAIVYYKKIKRHDLIQPMITGDKNWAEKIPVARDDLSLRWMAAGIFGGITAVLYYFLR